MTAPDRPSAADFAAALDACRAAEQALDDDADDDAAATADTEARDALIRLLCRSVERVPGDGCAAVLADGTVVAFGAESDGLVVAPAERVVRFNADGR